MTTTDRRLKRKDFRYAIYFFSLWSVVCGLWSAPAFAGEEWLEDAAGYEQGLTRARPIMLYFYTDWCPYCRRFEKNTLGSQAVQKSLSGFTWVRVNPEKGAREESLAQQFRVDGYPSVYLVAPGGKPKTKDVSRWSGSARDFEKAAADFFKLVPASSSVPHSKAEEPATPAITPDHALYLKNGRKVEGQLVSEDAKGVTLAMDELGEVYFSNSEVSKLEEIKK